MPEENHRVDETDGSDPTPEMAEPHAVPVPSAPPSAPPDSKRLRQMTDFPDGD
jgi:hypothetical protein